MALDDPRPFSSLIEVDPKRHSFRVNRAAYKSAEVFEREKAMIFGKCWLYLGHGTELKANGDYHTRRVGGRDIIFLKDRKGEVRAFFNTCTHRGSKICRERNGSARMFTCPYHGWVFDTEGKLKSRNTSTGYDEAINDDGHLNLHPVPRLEQYRNFWFLNYNPEAISLLDYLADATTAIDAICDQTEAEQAVIEGEHSYTIRANYKLLAENSYDGYHLLTVHESYLDFLSDQFAANADQATDANTDTSLKGYSGYGAARCLGMGHAVIDSYVPTGRPVAQWLPTMGLDVKDEIEAKRARLVELHGEERANYIAESQKNMVIFPNLVINDIVSTTIRYIEPESQNFMRVTNWAFGPTDESPRLRAIRLDNFISFLGPAGFGSPDDIEMLELCQQAAEHAPIEYSEISKGMNWEDDPRKLTGATDDELQMQAYWTQWDLVMRGIETLERKPEDAR